MTTAIITLGMSLMLAGPESAEEFVDRGMQRFRDNDIAGSIEDFDRAIELKPGMAPRLWQRGMSLYYAGKFDDARRQFEIHKTVNPHDVENATWHFACVARAEGIAAARKALIEIDTTRDTRVPMREVYELYAGRGSPDAVIRAADRDDRPVARMYAGLYLGLYYEVAGEKEKARKHIQQAAGQKLDDHYMHEAAKVHVKQRGW